MSKLNKHRLIMLVIDAILYASIGAILYASIMEIFFYWFPEASKHSIWLMSFLSADIWSEVYDAIFFKPKEWKDKYKDIGKI